jgi:hypothetical protein
LRVTIVKQVLAPERAGHRQSARKMCCADCIWNEDFGTSSDGSAAEIGRWNC